MVKKRDINRLIRFFLKINKDKKKIKRKNRLKKMVISKIDCGGKNKLKRIINIKNIKNKGLVFGIMI